MRLWRRARATSHSPQAKVTANASFGGALPRPIAARAALIRDAAQRLSIIAPLDERSNERAAAVVALRVVLWAVLSGDRVVAARRKYKPAAGR